MSQPSLDAPVVQYRLPDRKYREAFGISQSEMKELLLSPAHYLARYGPDASPFFPTPAMVQGTAIHCRALEPEVFASQYCPKSEAASPPTVADIRALLDERGVKYPKSAVKQDLLDLAFPDGVPEEKRTVLSDEDYQHVVAAAEALRTNEITGMWFSPGQRHYRKYNEVSIYIKNYLGQIQKGRIDRLQIESDRILILDLKTTQVSRHAEFQRVACNLNYDLQAAWYTELVRQAFPDRPVEFLFVALERKPPYGICVYRASDSLLASGSQKMQRALDLYAQCQALDYWPAYDPVIQELELPYWSRPEVAKNDF